MLASLVGFLGDFDLAEEAAQEAFAIAAERWPRDGVPRTPVAWLVTTAPQPRHRPAAPRADARGQDPAAGGAASRRDLDELDDDTTIPDERLELIFTCCHPALAVDAQVALTLRALGGLTTEEIARAFLVSEQTMSASVSPSQAQDQGDGIPFAVPRRPRCCRTAWRRCWRSST